jgi:hypothetical protein
MCREEGKGANYFFYRPFYATRRGHIVGLATTGENMRDGLALAQIARLFPLFEYDRIVVEPGRRTIQPGQNLILVGWHSRFFEEAPEDESGKHLVPSVRREKFERLIRLNEKSCFRMTGKQKRAIEDLVTGERHQPFRPKPGDRGRQEVDYGVIRRCFRGPTENTITIEGLHRLGTIAAAKVATDPVYLDAFRVAIEKLEGYDEAALLEILVRGVFDADEDRIYSLDRVRAEPLAMSYNAQWIFDFRGGLEWRDGLPWDIHIGVGVDRPPMPVPGSFRDSVLPRLELRADFRDHEGELGRMCRELLGGEMTSGGESELRPAEAVAPLIEALIAESERFDVELWEPSRGGAPPSVRNLPVGSASRIRSLRKRFVLQLLLSRLLNCPFRVSAESIRRNYPDFRRDLVGTTPEERDRELERKFIGQIAGRLGEGFGPLVTSSLRSRPYLSRRLDRATRTYSVRLERGLVVLKMRV